jgi:hypothetical protein
MRQSSRDIADILDMYGDSSGYDSDLIFSGATRNVFLNKEPSKPINSVTIYDTPGMPPYQGLDNVGYEYPSIQIRVRNDTQVNGWDLIEKIKDSLHGMNQITVNGTLYSSISCANGPALLEWDDNGNVVFFCNFNIQRRLI